MKLNKNEQRRVEQMSRQYHDRPEALARLVVENERALKDTAKEAEHNERVDTKAIVDALDLLDEIEAHVLPTDGGASTWDLAKRVRSFLRKYGLTPSMSRSMERAEEASARRTARLMEMRRKVLLGDKS